MSYDGARAVTVLFGGNAGNLLGDTWEWNGTSWIARGPATSPTARYGHTVAFDSARGVTVLFGGITFSDLGDTWEWNGAAWTQRSAISGVSARHYCAMAYDSARNVSVLFGGFYLPYQNIFADTWKWNGTAWSVPLTNPPTAAGFAMGYDSGRGVSVVFNASADTWEWDGANWVLRIPPTKPFSRSRDSIAYDSARGLTVLFGGYSDNLGTLGDTWVWNGTIWTQRNPATSPPIREQHAMAYDSARAVIVLFGGYGYQNNASFLLGDTWEWNGTNWTQRGPAVSPSARARYAMAYDSARGVTVLFGGQNGSGSNLTTLGDTWEWNGTNWTQRSPAVSPPARCLHAMVYDRARGVIFLFGGGANGTDFGDAWEWDGTTWTQRNTVATPQARIWHAMAYDSARGVTVLFGGYASSFFLADTWEFGANNPTISQQPAPQGVQHLGEPAHFSIVSPDATAFQWRRNQIPLTDGGNISGSHTATLTISPVSGQDCTMYDCIVTNDCGSTTSDTAWLGVSAVAADVKALAPTKAANPQSNRQ